MNLEEIKEGFFRNFDDKKNKKKLVLTLTVGAIGVILILGSNLLFPGTSKTDEKTSDGKTLTSTEYKAVLESNIRDTLNKVEGVGSCEVTITLDGENSKQIAYNETSSGSTSTDSSSRKSQQQTQSKDAILIKNGSESKPYPIEDKYPNVVGVVVVSEGAQDANVKYYITESIKTLLNVPAHKIVVLPMNSKSN